MGALSKVHNSGDPNVMAGASKLWHGAVVPRIGKGQLAVAIAETTDGDWTLVDVHTQAVVPPPEGGQLIRRRTPPTRIQAEKDWVQSNWTACLEDHSLPNSTSPATSSSRRSESISPVPDAPCSSSSPSGVGEVSSPNALSNIPPQSSGLPQRIKRRITLLLPTSISAQLPDGISDSFVYVPETLSPGTLGLPHDLSHSFNYVPESASTVARSFADRRPRSATAILWSWFVLLILGELAVTIWWFSSFGLCDLLILALSAVVVILSFCLFLRPQQVVAILISIVIASMPAMPAYSAVLLIVPPPVTGFFVGIDANASAAYVRPWCRLDALHWLTLMTLGVLHFAAALPATLSGGAPRQVLEATGVAKRAARLSLIFLGSVYGALVLCSVTEFLFSWANFSSTLQSLGNRGCCTQMLFRSGFALELYLNALGLLCAELRRRTCTALGTSLLPRLIGAHTARKLTLRELASRYGMTLLRHVPDLRRWSPPPYVVAFILALQRVAPLLLPTLALLSKWGYLPISGLVIVLFMLALVAFLELRTVPQAPLRRLPLLLPSIVEGRARTALGFALEAAETLEVSRSMISKSFKGLRRRVRLQQ